MNHPYDVEPIGDLIGGREITMEKPRMIGSINAHSLSACIIGGQRTNFNGTTLGLAQTAAAHGAQPGDTIRANYGGRSEEGMDEFTVIAAPHDQRAGGLWITRKG